MMKPDYQRSIVNLMASVSAGLDAGPTGYPPLPELPPARFDHRPVALLLIDGLGEALLARHPESHLARQRIGRLTSVFPSTTASAITTFYTGVAPQQHAITGWHMWLRELGSVAAILPFAPRHGGPAYEAIEPAALIGAAAVMDRLAVPVALLSPAYIADSIYSRFGGGAAERMAYDSLQSFFARLVERLRGGRPGYLFAYWTELDALAHHYGIDSPQVHDHFQRFDRAFGAALEQLRGSGALLLATADHGLVDTTAERTLRLEDHPQLATTLALPLCGEPRTAYCYLRPGREQAFLDYVAGALAHACVAIPAAQLIAEGWFGTGPAEARLERRVGDYVLMMRENFVLHDRLANERPFRQIGVHGGASQAEMSVPLLLCEP